MSSGPPFVVGNSASSPASSASRVLCAEAMQDAARVKSSHRRRLSTGRPQLDRGSNSPAPSEADATPEAPAALARLEQNAKALRELQLVHRSATLRAVATGGLTAAEAIVRVDTVTRFEALARHAWRSAAHLVGRGQ